MGEPITRAVWYRDAAAAPSSADRRREPIIGWLVCTKGPNLGRSFELRTGRCTLGRGPHHWIDLSPDEGVHRNPPHAYIKFYTVNQSFGLEPERGAVVYHRSRKAAVRSDRAQTHNSSWGGEEPLGGDEGDEVGPHDRNDSPAATGESPWLPVQNEMTLNEYDEIWIGQGTYLLFVPLEVPGRFTWRNRDE